MVEEIQETEVVTASQPVEMTYEPDETVEAVVFDQDDAPVVEADAGATAVAEPVTAYYAPRGKWDFTEGQRIVLGLLIWLNILVLVAGYLALTGYLGV